ncbi:hypothetical protein HUG10_20495 (plasmid) [Halorarum halophilum]|uniref:Uncharacterized protein n=1 Tax=Halorarum halophilum TaxID=2743090 RepID=A0A7D5GZZ7_9EURY|nr:hypothetical protein [Halobaculum halophilum]QLG29989.1 hypothetical protein HUG10_20495 [Halobaculum halophilum]
MESSNKTRANHAFVVRGTLQASDDLIEAIDDHPDIELVYQKHSAAKLYIRAEDEETDE